MAGLSWAAVTVCYLYIILMDQGIIGMSVSIDFVSYIYIYILYIHLYIALDTQYIVFKVALYRLSYTC